MRSMEVPPASVSIYEKTENPRCGPVGLLCKSVEDLEGFYEGHSDGAICVVPVWRHQPRSEPSGRVGR